MNDSEILDWLEGRRGVEIITLVDGPMMGERFAGVPQFSRCVVEEDGGELLGHGKTVRAAIENAAKNRD